MKTILTFVFVLILSCFATVQDKAPTVLDLLKRIEALEEKIKSVPVVHHGNIKRSLPKGKLASSIKIRHDLTQYKDFSIVACESGSSGTLVMAKAEAFADDHFFVTLRRHNDSAAVAYDAEIAWILVGTKK